MNKYFMFNLQLLADDDIEDSNEVDATNGNQVDDSEKVVTYTQEELDAKIRKAKKNTRQEITSSEQYKEFLKQQEANKEQTQKVNTYEKEYQEAMKKIQEYEYRDIANKNDAIDSEYVAYKASKLVDEDTTFEEAIEILKNKNPNMFRTEQATNVQTAVIKNNKAVTNDKPEYIKILEKKHGISL